MSNDSCIPNPQYVRTRQSSDFNAAQGNKDNLIQCCLNLKINTGTQGRNFVGGGGGVRSLGGSLFLVKVHG